MRSTPSKAAVTLAVTHAIAEAIHGLSEVPSGHLYAHVMHFMDLQSYIRAKETLKRVGLITETNHLLRWVGPDTMMDLPTFATIITEVSHDTHA